MTRMLPALHCYRTHFLGLGHGEYSVAKYHKYSNFTKSKISWKCKERNKQKNAEIIHHPEFSIHCISFKVTSNSGTLVYLLHGRTFLELCLGVLRFQNKGAMYA